MFKKYKTHIIVLLFTILEIVIFNSQKYYIYDHNIVIPFINKIMCKSLYPSDYIIGEMKYYYTILWHIVACILKFTHIDIKALFTLIYILTIYFRFFALYLITRIITKNETATYLSLFIFLFNRFTFTNILLQENMVITRFVVAPFLIFSIYYFLARDYIKSYIFLGIGFLIHPLSSLYVIIMIIVATFFEIKEIGIKKFIISLTIFFIISSPIIIWRIVYSPESLNFIPDKNWVLLLRLRSPEHLFPLSWKKDLYIQNFLFITGYFITWRNKPEFRIHRMIVIFSSVIFSLCLIGFIFSEFLPLTLILNLQVFRSFIYIYIFGVIYFVHYFYEETKEGKKLIYKFLTLIVAFFILYGFAIFEVILSVFIIITFTKVIYQYRNLNIKEKYLNNLILLMMLLVVIFLKIFIITKYSDTPNKKAWIDAQEWAKKNTRINDVFIVPPTQYGFRIQSERTIYGDWYDGTLLNFNPEFGYEWFRRMKKLGYNRDLQELKQKKIFYKDGLVDYQDFNDLYEEDFRKISQEIFNWESKPERIYIVRWKSEKCLNFKEVYKNSRFIVYEISKE